MLTIPLSPGDPLGIVRTSVGSGVMTPWRQAIGELVAGSLPCVTSSGSGSDALTWTLNYRFEPLTDYLIDIHAVPIGSAAAATGLVHRIGFTTSRFADVDELAAFIGPSALRHRVVTDPGPLQSPVLLPDLPSGDQLDAAFQAAGLPAPQTPDFPEVVVLWSADAVPQPVAVMLDCSEPLWRSRLVPTVVAAPPDAPDPTHTYWAARPADWLSVADSTAAAAAGDLPRATVNRIVHGPGGTRAVAILAPGARGHEVRLDLVTAADPLAGTPERRSTAARVGLTAAPWEVQD
jgi:hypothetical protein